MDRNDIYREIDRCLIVTRALKASTISDRDLPYIKSYRTRLEMLRDHVAISILQRPDLLYSLLITLWSAREYFQGLGDSGESAEMSARRAAVRVRSLEATIDGLEIRTASVSNMVVTIKEAHETAERLPMDLQQLREAKTEISVTRDESSRSGTEISRELEKAKQLVKELQTLKGEAKNVMDSLDAAYAAATSEGLASAFFQNSLSLNRSIYVWTAGLVVALVVGGLLGSSRVSSILEMLRIGNISAELVTLQLVLAVISVGPAIWFAWLSTKQIGQRFRLAEDYSFKAAVSKAYQGFQREADRVDPDLKAQLLKTALSRLDEQPLRFVEPGSHGSPIHEALSSGVIREAFARVPDFGSRLEGLARDALGTIRSRHTGQGTDRVKPEGA